MKLMIHYEYTDTFGGQANYAWIKRGTLQYNEPLSDKAVVRRVKAALGLTGVRCTTQSYGDMIEVRPIGICQVIFITFN